MMPMIEPDDPDAYASALLAAFKRLNGCTMLDAFMAMKAGEITDAQLHDALMRARLAIETQGRA